jgi:hypothetical protein
MSHIAQLYLVCTCFRDVMLRSWLNPRSKCLNFAQRCRFAILAKRFLLRSKNSTAGSSCKDSSIITMPLVAHETNDNRVQPWDFCTSWMRSAKMCLNASYHENRELFRKWPKTWKKDSLISLWQIEWHLLTRKDFMLD